MDPFQKNMTISQLCMDFYKSTYLKEDTIARIPPNGYHANERQSKRALQWLKYIEQTNNITIPQLCMDYYKSIYIKKMRLTIKEVSLQ